MRINNLPAHAYKRSMPNIRANYWLDLKPDTKSAPCGPVAAANVIRYLAEKNCSRLIPLSYRLDEHYLLSRLIEALAEEMNTKKKGTVPIDLADGIEKYVKNRGYKISIKYSGQAFNEKDKNRKNLLPERIMEGVLGPYNSILFLCNYKYNSRKDGYKYEKGSGHAVTGAGFVRDWDELLTHDSASIEQSPVHYRLFEMSNKKLITSDGTTIQSSQYYELRECNSYGELSRTWDDTKITALYGALSFEVTPK